MPNIGLDSRDEPRSPESSQGLKPPAAIDVEKRVLGAMLIDPEAIPKVMEALEPTSFYLKGHQAIYESMLHLFKANEPVDTVTVFEELSKQKKIDVAGGAPYLTELSQNISSGANVEYHAEIVKEKALLRELITISHQIASSAYQGEGDAYEILDQGEHQIFEISQKRMKKSYTTMDDAIKETINHIELLHSDEYKKLAVPTGFYDLDEILGGFQKSDFVIVAARPSMGKTALALTLARNAAVQHNVPIALFSLEMSTVQLVTRLICAEGRLNAHQVRTGKLPAEDARQIAISGGKLKKAPLFIDDSPAQSILEVRAKCRRLKSEHKIGMVMIDYLQLMQGPARSESREREISQISQSLKALAKELEIPVIALAQLNRAVEARTDKRPLLSDLRESGSLEQDADVVMFINRPEYYGIETYEDGSSTEGISEIIVAKHRNGPTGLVKLRFVKDYARFENLEIFRDEKQIPQNAGTKPVPKNEDII